MKTPISQMMIFISRKNPKNARIWLSTATPQTEILVQFSKILAYFHRLKLLTFVSNGLQQLSFLFPLQSPEWYLKVIRQAIKISISAIITKLTLDQSTYESEYYRGTRLSRAASTLAYSWHSAVSGCHQQLSPSSISTSSDAAIFLYV